ncbi:hypothetical protein E8E13_003037 [Curvularia kusanoi]|uniref:Uncharacterized protein n=1 Tax=Curvularia kusanoi TaxID=90978 RepID=A0A9P4T9V3_CURKU|nr:hypothetical protein E8E13_003037 [Curvularia kusanoi]
MAEAVAVAVDKVEVAGGVDTAELVFTVTTITFADEVDESGDFVDVEEGLVDIEEDFAGVGWEDLQSPKPDLEQQFPNTEPLQSIHVKEGKGRNGQ